MKTQEIKRGKFNAYYKISDLKPAEINRDMVIKHAEGFKTKLNDYGWLMPIVIDKYGNIIEGHHRVKSAIMLKQETIPVYIVDWIDARKEKEQLECIISLNNGNKAWSKLDYLKAYSKTNTDYKIVYDAFKQNTSNLSVGNIIGCYFRENNSVFKKGLSKIENKKFADYLSLELSSLYNEFGSGVAAYCVREFISVIYDKANMDKKATNHLLKEYRRMSKQEKELATSIKSFRPMIEYRLSEYLKR